MMHPVTPLVVGDWRQKTSANRADLAAEPVILTIGGPLILRRAAI
jgi:hypothetical protein